MLIKWVSCVAGFTEHWSFLQSRSLESDAGTLPILSWGLHFFELSPPDLKEKHSLERPQRIPLQVAEVRDALATHCQTWPHSLCGPETEGNFNLLKKNPYQAQCHAASLDPPSESLIFHPQLCNCEKKFQFQPRQELRNSVWKLPSWWSLQRKKIPYKELGFDLSLPMGALWIVLQCRLKNLGGLTLTNRKADFLFCEESISYAYKGFFLPIVKCLPLLVSPVAPWPPSPSWFSSEKNNGASESWYRGVEHRALSGRHALPHIALLGKQH